MQFRVLHHNHCFDGACSAAVFTKFHRECVGGASGYEYVGLQHGPKGGVDEAVFGPGQNAIVDFRYSRSEKLTWWFDHHQSAFATPEDRAAFERGQLGPLRERQFFDPLYVSCTGWIAAVGKQDFAFETDGLGELLKWADIIDGARFESAESAVEMKAPAMKLALVIENATEADFIPRVIPLLTSMPFAEIVEQPFVKEKIGPLWERHLSQMAMVRERATVTGGVIYMDLADREVEALNKFIPYYYYPEATYMVVLSRSSARVKVSVGTSPWTREPVERLVNLAAICESFGGGGHARVGAISLAAEDLERGRVIAQGIAADLREAVSRAGDQA